MNGSQGKWFGGGRRFQVQKLHFTCKDSEVSYGKFQYEETETMEKNQTLYNLEEKNNVQFSQVGVWCGNEVRGIQDGEKNSLEMA